jgi:hypothetical protein
MEGMKMRCPLPIDWLDFIESGSPDTLAAHLDACPSCQTLVASLRSSADSRDLDDWLSKIDLTEAVVWRPRAIESVGFGQLVLNASGYSGKDDDYENAPRLLFLVLDDGRGIGGRRWHGVAPADTDVENASSTDLLLNADETSLGVRLRVLFSLQTFLAEEQLDEQVGMLTSAGEEVVRQALAGELDQVHFGLPLESPDDERLAIDRETEAVVRRLRTPFFAIADEVAAAERETEAATKRGEQESLGRLLIFNLDWVRARGGQLALAAKTEAEDVIATASLKSELGEIEGHLRYDLQPDMLFFVIDRLARWQATEIRLVLYTKTSEEIESKPFVPRVGEEVEVGSLFPYQVEELAVKVS